MNAWVLTLGRIASRHAPYVGGKAVALAKIAKSPAAVPQGVCITTEAFEAYLTRTGLRDRIALELARTPLAQMRSEELWDLALRIRGLFLTTEIPKAMRGRLAGRLRGPLAEAAVAVRSTAIGEDSAGRSFAGLHDSYINVRGKDEVLDRVRQVWASLYSDAALAYRRQMNLDPATGTMAVLVQEMVFGRCSGVVFSTDPTDAERLVVEAVYGLNQGLVDGSVEPDHWVLDRRTLGVLSHDQPKRRRYAVAAADGVAIRPLPAAKRGMSPLRTAEVTKVADTSLEMEQLFGGPQDVEWTLRKGAVNVLQSRDITAGAAVVRPSPVGALTGELRALQSLGKRIEGEHLPAMARQADDMDAVDLTAGSNAELRRQLADRLAAYNHWLEVYREQFIPMSHGVQLFGRLYADTMRPDDPFEFIELLAGEAMLSVRRNARLERLAQRVRNSPAALSAARSQDMDALAEALGDGVGELAKALGGDTAGLVALVARMALRPSRSKRPSRSTAALRKRFLAAFKPARRSVARRALAVGRASYRLRDDDNLYLGRIARQVDRACEEVRRRGLKDVSVPPGPLALNPTAPISSTHKAGRKLARDAKIRIAVTARQLLGQPAGAGVAAGVARVIHGREDLMDIQAGEVLVCGALDPNMTFVLPLVAAVVERRGGMLIHGAIIAREYGIPCVTGVGDLESMVANGDHLTVDGYLGIVTVNKDIL